MCVDGPPAGALDCGNGIGSGPVLDVDNKHRGAFASEQERRLPADAAAGAGDERGLPLQTHRLNLHFLLCFVVFVSFVVPHAWS